MILISYVIYWLNKSGIMVEVSVKNKDKDSELLKNLVFIES